MMDGSRGQTGGRPKVDVGGDCIKQLAEHMAPHRVHPEISAIA